MPKFNVRCLDCQHVWEVSKAFEVAATCPECHSTITRTLLTGFQYTRVGDPMDQVHQGMALPDGKKITSFSNDRRRGGKDTT